MESSYYNNIVKITIALIIVFFVFYSEPAQSGRVEDIKKIIESIESSDEVVASVAADEALKSEDSLLRSMALKKILMSSSPQVRSVGFIYLIKSQKRIVVEAMSYESTLEDESIIKVDRESLSLKLIIEITISNFNEKTSRFEARVSGIGGGEGAVGQDGIRIIANDSVISLKSAVGDYLVGGIQYRLSNTKRLIPLPARAALP